MAIKPGDINKNGHLTHMVAEDLFSETEDPNYKGAKQVFNAKTGKWIGTLKPGDAMPQELNFDAPTEPEEPEVKNPNGSHQLIETNILIPKGTQSELKIFRRKIRNKKIKFAATWFGIYAVSVIVICLLISKYTGL